MVEKIENKKQFAVKAFSKSKIIRNSFGIKSIKNEINILRNLNHKNIISFEEVSETKNSLYIIMEYLEGSTLMDLANLEIPIKTERIKLMKELLQVASYLETQKIIHRDIKPDNLLFQISKVNGVEIKQIKLIDFGLSASMEESSHIFKTCGTVGFMAPEVFLQKESDEVLNYNYKSDIFSLGIIFFCMIFGKHPFYGKTVNDSLQKNKAAIINWEAVSKLGEKYVEEELKLVKNMLQYNPDNRGSANELLDFNCFKEFQR